MLVKNKITRLTNELMLGIEIQKMIKELIESEIAC